MPGSRGRGERQLARRQTQAMFAGVVFQPRAFGQHQRLSADLQRHDAPRGRANFAGLRQRSTNINDAPDFALRRKQS